MDDLYSTQITTAQVDSLITGAIRESVVLEYKRADAAFDDRAKNEIAKDVSAMANSGGGIIIYGIATDENDKTRPLSITGVNAKHRNIRSSREFQYQATNQGHPKTATSSGLAFGDDRQHTR